MEVLAGERRCPAFPKVGLAFHQSSTFLQHVSLLPYIPTKEKLHSQLIDHLRSSIQQKAQ